MKPLPRPEGIVEFSRIRSSALLALALFVCALVIDGPVTILGWTLMMTGFVCLFYVAIASTVFLKQFKSQNRKPDTNDTN